MRCWKKERNKLNILYFSHIIGKGLSSKFVFIALFKFWINYRGLNTGYSKTMIRISLSPPEVFQGFISNK